MNKFSKGVEIKSIIWISYVKVLATFSVIFLHVAAPILNQFGKIPNYYWWIGNIYDGLVRFCVPFFFLVSGALLLSRDYELDAFLKKRVSRILPSFIFWSIVYVLVDEMFQITSSFSFFYILKKIIQGLFHGSEYHLWFVYVLIGLYLLTPILRKWVKAASNKEIKYFLAIWLFTFLYNIKYINTYLPQINLINFSGYIGYFVLGYYLANRVLFKKNGILLFFFILSIVITIVGTFYITNLKGAFDAFFYKYQSFNVLLTSLCLFLIFKNKSFNHLCLNKIVKRIDQNSYGIYLIHVLILIIFNYYNINWKLFNPLLSIPLLSIAVFLISYILIFLLKSNKYTKLISG